MTKHVRYTLKRRAAVINLDEIFPGDQVTIRDGGDNLVVGQVEGVTGQRHVKAFGVSIPFAREGKNGKWMPVKGVRVVAHLPAMFPAQAQA